MTSTPIRASQSSPHGDLPRRSFVTEKQGKSMRFTRLTLATATTMGVLSMLYGAAVLAQICPYDTRCINNPYGAGSPYSPDSINNSYGQYGSPYSNKSANNPYATDAPKLYDSEGNYRGRLSANPYDPDSTSNPYGRYGSPTSPDSINNPYGAGSPHNTSPIFVVPQ